MIYIILTALIAGLLIYPQRRHPAETLPYELIDDIASERERVKAVEDLISVLEAYDGHPDEDEELKVFFSDPSGEYKFTVEKSQELLKYLYTERRRIKSDLSDKLRTISN